ncbi:MAG TPA: hypothetical protein VMF90_24415 [Rhizobiaceae bacterium]|nr:hypothetical protein [Rhizobiaceae bacterium]
MATLTRTFAKALAGGVFLAAACLPLSAQTVDLGIANVDVNDNGGRGLGVDATVGNAVDASVGLGSGGRSGTNVDATASIGGRNGINADADVDIGGSNGALDANATASIGGRSGVNADVDLGVDDGIDAGVEIGIGDLDVPGLDLPGFDERPVTGLPPLPGDEDDTPPVAGGRVPAPSQPGIAGLNVNRTDMARYGRRCQEIVRNAASYDAELVALCQIASR